MKGKPGEWFGSPKTSKVQTNYLYHFGLNVHENPAYDRASFRKILLVSKQLDYEAMEPFVSIDKVYYGKTTVTAPKGDALYTKIESMPRVMQGGSGAQQRQLEAKVGVGTYAPRYAACTS
ncbi:hypothetical protein LTR56_022946 [Elasticomyces elasticus]|nr:hypothetical protein LTR56_022946 [Elasticomyces elasticus]KAK4910820.1 hypothetical protein LTR49_020515 [Elasticomyces elasticus]KAK5750397.1 hypothetical protein LTS12_019505 [Elasticomyces elasticus]